MCRLHFDLEVHNDEKVVRRCSQMFCSDVTPSIDVVVEVSLHRRHRPNRSPTAAATLFLRWSLCRYFLMFLPGSGSLVVSAEHRL